MNNPNNASESQKTSESDNQQPDNHSSVNGASSKSRHGFSRFWLLSCLLSILIVLLTVREDLRRDTLQTGKNASSYVAFDVLGWSPRDIFIWRLRFAGLLDSPLGQRWANAVERANENAVQTGRQYSTVTDFTSDEVEAHVYQVSLERGEKLIWQLDRLDEQGHRLYASLERRESEGEEWSTVKKLEADKAASQLIAQTGDYRFVLQPELFGRAEYSMAVANGGSLPFPVESASQRDIGSNFGAPRDGGARAHHGVDIFAEKGTPVTAVIEGHIRTGTGNIGGKHIWLSGGLFGLGSARYYYAHLDSFAVESGDEVQRGDVIGYVGNTGNARTTPPHLHFGIYSGGPVEPAPFLKPEPALPDR